MNVYLISGLGRVRDSKRESGPEGVRGSKRNMTVIESIKSWIVGSIGIRLRTQWVTRYVASNVVLTVLLLFTLYTHIRDSYVLTERPREVAHYSLEACQSSARPRK